MIEQKYLVVKALGPRKRKHERFEVKYFGEDPQHALKEMIDRMKLRDVIKAYIVPYKVEDDGEMTFRTLMPTGKAIVIK